MVWPELFLQHHHHFMGPWL